MSKVIAGKSLSTHYTPVSNALIRNSEIDDGTFRLICWMTSHTEGWEVNFNSIKNSLGYGRDKLRKILKTAEIQNYLVRRKIRTEAGLFDFEYHIFKDTNSAIAFRESLQPVELTSDLFLGGGATRGGKTGGGQTRGGESTPLLEEQYRENQKEEKHTQFAPQTQESCVCETEQLNLEEPTPEKPSLEESTPEEPIPQQPTLLLKNCESSQQTDNPSRGSTIAVGSFDKSEQANKPQLTCPYKTAKNVKELIDAWLTDPTAMSDDSLPLLVRETIKWNCWVLPWRNGERKLNNLYQNFNPVVVDFLAQELATKSKRSARQEIDHAIAVMNTWEKTKGGWTNLMQRLSQAQSAETQRLAQQKAIQTAHAAPNELRAVLPEIRQARRFTKVA
ncbi:hypothetical protein [Nostoc sp. ChiQUE01b]|uniref:hypothetical protein n=1 Tax=Nostoc sp. ChiQUE01b TaxID=3075376 RepID=UPI002AD461B1|nr:hypothetical protein [Nostoc sp. ChiQUE01b]MDZ8258948.1 hypothetical protein [Nostoc sp. ChiQUE01b]